MAEDVTIFTDDTVRCDGPIRPGPTLLEWTRTVDDETLAEITTPAVAAEIRAIEPTTFPSRLVQSAYLAWFRRHVQASALPNIDVVEHRPPGRRRAATSPTARSPCGWRAPTSRSSPTPSCSRSATSTPGRGTAGRWSSSPSANDLVHLPAGHTADQDLVVLEPGEDVIALGFGQAFTDLVALVTEGRGGRFETAADGRRRRTTRAATSRSSTSGRGAVCRTAPSSTTACRARRHRCRSSSTTSPSSACSPRRTRCCSGATSCRSSPRRSAGPTTTSCSTPTVSARRATGTRSPSATRRCHASDDELDALVAATVPGPGRPLLDPGARPPARRAAASTRRRALHDHVSAHVAADVARRTNPAYSADLGAFIGLLWTFGTVGRIGASGKVAPRSRGHRARRVVVLVLHVLRQRPAAAPGCASCWRSPTSASSASSAPARRSRPTRVERRFVARSTSHDDVVTARAYVDARIATASVTRTADAMLARLHAARGGDRGGRRRRRGLVGQHRQGRRRRRQPPRAARRLERADAGSASACSRTARPPARSPGRARTPRRSASTTPSPARR